jgi:predicted alpha/beta superfamily hydrolase
MSTRYPPVSLPNSEVRLLESSIVEDTYRLNIALPVEYADSDKAYPVVYATDGNSNIFTLAHLVGALNLSQELPPLIIVGIGYPTDNLSDILQLRLRDLVPTYDPEAEQVWKEFFQLESIPSPGADRFLRFIREELKPFINANYRTDPDDSAYVGFSAGGTFGLYTLFHHPDTFSRYVIGSPPIHIDNKVMLTYESNYAESHNDLPVRVFMSVGGREESDDPLPLIEPRHQFVTNIKTLARTLQERNYPGMQLTSHVFEDETHMSVIPATFSRGLRVVFS